LEIENKYYGEDHI
jgi:tetratricopeptide (TPR) repeat protein